MTGVRVWCLAALLVALGCRDSKSPAPEASEASPSGPSAGTADARPPWDASAQPPAVPVGMVWIPGGALVAGTPPDRLPRIADEEMPGEQVILEGFFISRYPYPNEEAAIPLANVTRSEAAALCAKDDKRLCTELEWERACKGPSNTTYEYGDRYRAEVCSTGAEPRMLPSGLRVACRSDFGVHDLHGGLWEWTSSPWGRDTRGDLATVRGGNGSAGELVGRCANAMGRPPEQKSSQVGFRCCAGPENEAKVIVHVERERPVERVEPIDAAIGEVVDQNLPEESTKTLGDARKNYRSSKMWFWHPIGNEELTVLGGCGGPRSRRRCGAVVVKMVLGKPQVLSWTESGKYVPTIQVDHDARYLWIYGGDERSHYRRLVTYAWGRVQEGRLERNVRPRKEKKPRSKKQKKKRTKTKRKAPPSKGGR